MPIVCYFLSSYFRSYNACSMFFVFEFVDNFSLDVLVQFRKPRRRVSSVSISASSRNFELWGKTRLLFTNVLVYFHQGFQVISLSRMLMRWVASSLSNSSRISPHRQSGVRAAVLLWHFILWGRTANLLEELFSELKMPSCSNFWVSAMKSSTDSCSGRSAKIASSLVFLKMPKVFKLLLRFSPLLERCFYDLEEKRFTASVNVCFRVNRITPLSTLGGGLNTPGFGK